MIKHHMTKFTTEDGLIVQSWLQINIFKKAYCFSKKQYAFDKRTTAL